MNRGTKSQQMNMCAQSQLDNQGSGGGMNGCLKTANNEAILGNRNRKVI